MSRLMATFNLALGLAGASPAYSVPLTWTFDGAQFDDGTSLTGCFLIWT